MFLEADIESNTNWQGDRGYPWIWGQASSTLFST